MAVYKAKMPEAWARVEWCVKQFGHGGNNRWWRDAGHLCFTNEQDYMFYLLKWG